MPNREFLSILIALVWMSFVHPLNAKSVGTFGGFIHKDGRVDVPNSNGFLTFSADNRLYAHRLNWERLLPGKKAFSFAEVRFPIAHERGLNQLIDWTSLKISSPLVSAYLSRSMPVAHYESMTKSFEVATGLDGRKPMGHLAVVLNGKITHFDLNKIGQISLRHMSEPWILMWAGDQKGWHFDVPLLLTFQKRPQAIRVQNEGVQFSFSSGMGALNVLPLRGIERFKNFETVLWKFKLPGYAIVESRSWVTKLVAFPAGMKETHNVDLKQKRVHITDHYSYRFSPDDWGTTPKYIAPLPPVVVRAGHKKYPVTYPRGRPISGPLATFYGPFAYSYGKSSAYSIPLASALERLPIPMRVENSEIAKKVRAELENILTNKMPRGPSKFYVHNDDIASALMCDAYPTLAKNGKLRQKIEKLVPHLFEGSFSNAGIPLSREPVTNQHYRSPGKHQYENTPFDREWYTGRKLAAITRCAEFLDSNLAKKNWKKILDLYRYSQIFYDWVTGSVTSSVFGLNQLADGIHFIWEGVLGVARMAKLVGDHATYLDASYRASRQQLALYAIWYHAEWIKQKDYAIAHFSGEKLPLPKIETRGAIDAWVEHFGAATLEFESNWQTANFIYFDNAAQYAFYRDYGIISKIKQIEYEVMPKLHPHWKNGNVMDKIDHRYYGSGHTIAHLLARAVLFHDSPRELYQIYRSFEGTEVAKQWYTPYFFGNSGPLLLGIERAQAPVFEVPVSDIKVIDSSYDDKANRVNIEFSCHRDKSITFRKKDIGSNWKSKDVSCRTDEVIRLEF